MSVRRPSQLRRLAVAGAMIIGGLAASAPVSAEPVARFVAEASTGGCFEVVGLAAGDLEALRAAAPPTAAWRTFFTVHSLDETGAVAPRAMLGRHEASAEGVRFIPRFPPVPGLSYRIRLDLASLLAPAESDLTAQADDGSRPVESVFEASIIEAVVAVPATDAPTVVVEQIYPTIGQVPANLLKVYLHFSGAMARGEAYRRIKLLGPDGMEVPDPFLEIDEELWDPGQRRLTLFFDPGRIKRGLRPHAEAGPPLTAGGRYRLKVDGAWPDAHGRPLGAGFDKALEVTAEDRESPRMSMWQVSEPRGGTREALVVTFAEPMDHALALRLIRVERTRAQTLDGVSSLHDEERTWRFVPTEPWRAGEHQLSIDGALEDLAGNSLRGAFDRDVTQGEHEAGVARFERPFAVRE